MLVNITMEFVQQLIEQNTVLLKQNAVLTNQVDELTASVRELLRFSERYRRSIILSVKAAIRMGESPSGFSSMAHR